VAQHFVKAGYAKVFALKGGWNEWEKGRHPTESKE
jgi:3-mercaptopyruvate sulfurtransferase SseA